VAEEMHLSVSVEGGVGTIRVRGDLDITTAPALRDLALSVLRDGATRLVVDCIDLTFIDSAGLNVLVQAHRAARAQRGTLTIRRPSRMLLSLLEMTDLDGVLTIEP
jgi:anti-sigma B factor antagonist